MLQTLSVYSFWKELEQFDEFDVSPATKNALKDKLQEVAYKLNKEEFTW